MASRRNRLWVLGWSGSRRLLRIPVLGRAIAFFSNRVFARHFVADLSRLHDLLADTELAGRYWIWSGLLLGWAREGDILAHDRDADFALLSEDLPKLIRAIPAMRSMGFRPLERFRNNLGEVTELTFRKHSAKFEFFVFEPIDGMLRYHTYGWPPHHLVELEARIPHQDLVPFEFLDRTWLKPADHELELQHMYGEWRVPQRKWNYLQDDRATVSRRPWMNSDTTWPNRTEERKGNLPS